MGAGQCYVHFLKGSTADHERVKQAEKDRKGPSPWPPRWDLEIEAIYPYSQSGALLYEVVRRAGKKFSPRHQVEGKWFLGYGFKEPASHTILYRLDEVRSALGAGDTVYICEGEKDADAIVKVGGVATTWPGGTGMGFAPQHAESLASIESQSRLDIMADLDAPGLKQATEVRIQLKKAGVNSERVRICKARTGKDPADHLSWGLGLDDFAVISDEELADYLPEVTEIERAFSSSSISSWIEADGRLVVPEPRKWIVPDFLPLGISGLIIAKGGTGKSFFSISLALSLALQEPFGPFQVPEEAGVIIASKEEDLAEMQRRMYFSAAARWGAPPKFSPMQAEALERCFHPVDLLGLRGAQLGEDLVAHLAALCSRYPNVRLILLDPIGKFLPENCPELNSQEGAGFVHDWISLIVRETSCTVLANHHIRKASSEGRMQLDSTAATGSQQLIDYARWALNLMRLDAEGVRRYALDATKGPYVLGAVSKTNYSAPLQTPLILRAGDGGGLVPLEVASVVDVDAERLLDVMRQLGAGGYITRDEMRKISQETHGLTKHEVDRARSCLIEAGQIETIRRRSKGSAGTRTLFGLAALAPPAVDHEEPADADDDPEGDELANWWDR